MNEPEQLAAFVAAVFDPHDIIEIRSFGGRIGRPVQTWHHAREAAAILERCRGANAAGAQVYVGANPRKRFGAGDARGVAIARAVFADFDGGHLQATEAKAQVGEALARAHAAGLAAPSIVVHSGHGVHAWWLLDEPLHDLAAWCELMAGLVERLQSDRSVKDPPRIMRLPGLMNHKPPPAPAVLCRCDPDCRVSAAELGRVLQSSSPGTNRADVRRCVEQFASRSRGREGEGGRVIGQFNQRVELRELLASYGYDIRGRHYRRPGKAGDGFSGMIRHASDGREVVAAFSTNDPLNDRKFGAGTCGIHDAFGAFVLLACGGDERAAVREAARLLGIPKTRGRSDDAILRDLRRGEDGDAIRRLLATPSEQSRQQIRLLIAKHTPSRPQCDRVLARVLSRMEAA